jgi:hypothetical protein
VYVVDAVNAEVAPVAVMVFAPPVWSTTVPMADVNLQDPAPVVLEPPGVVPVVHVTEVVVNIVVAIVTDSPLPKPVSVKVSEIDCPGKPKLLPEALIETLDVMVKGVLTEFVPSDTTMV